MFVGDNERRFTFSNFYNNVFSHNGPLVAYARQTLGLSFHSRNPACANQTCTVEQSTDFTAWANNGQLTAGAAGSVSYSYTIAPVEERFYRFRKQ